ncbi:hypothetical protein AAFN88_18320 [Pelagibius sp. CAU 1746]|uniref:COG3904 family protein n=1 Tax=Pelagibius sp. CAU 1746 TaxID=3140370 RepID=UPI00325BE688
MTGPPPAKRRGLLAGYLGAHWQGRQSLAWSFWVNLVLLRAAILLLDRFTRPPFLEDQAVVAAVTVAFFLVFHVAVFAWQVVGVVRACDAYQSDFGVSGLTLIAYVGIAGAVAVTLTSTVGAFLLLFREPEGEPEYLAWERDRAARYHLAPDPQDPTLLRFTGTFELGVTKKLTALLQARPDIRGIVLDSPGGHVYEGRGVAKLILRYGLDTFVFRLCSSACTTAFIAGKVRVLGPEGRLGFHQHWMDADYPVYLVDEEAEMQKDLAFYEAQGISEGFREQVFVTPHDGLWFPSVEEMRAAGVVDRISETPE